MRASPDRLLCRPGAVQRHYIADTAGHGRFHGVAKAGRDLRLRRQAPVGEQPENVTVNGDRRSFLDDQRAGQTATELLQAGDMRVIPERAGIGRRELVGESPARLDRRLREARHAIHGIGQADAMPVHGSILVEAVLDDDTRRFALPQAHDPSWHGTTIRPDLRTGTVRSGKTGACRPGCDADVARRIGARRP